jgi:hypothetical protein
MPVGGLLVSGAIGLGSAIYKGIRAKKQRKEAEKINPIRPDMTRTNASKEQEAMFRNMANSTRLPGQSYAENKLGAQSARATNAILGTGGSTAEIINGLTNVDQNSRESSNDLAMKGASLNQQNKQMYADVLSNVSQEQKEIFDYNKNQPYQTDVLRKQSLLDASSRNTDNALSSLQDTAGNVGNAIGYKKALMPDEETDLGIGSGNTIATSLSGRKRRR